MRTVIEAGVLALLATHAHADEPKRPTPPDSASLDPAHDRDAAAPALDAASPRPDSASQLDPASIPRSPDAGAPDPDAVSSSSMRVEPPPPPDIEAVGVLGIARHDEGRVDTSFSHAIDHDALAIVPSARLHIGHRAFLEGTIPLGYGQQASAAALGNVTITAGLLPERGRLAGVALRLSAPTSPSVGSGMATAAALAAPRNADPELFLPHTTSTELVADLRWRGETTWLQAEAGLAGWWRPSGFETVLRTTIAGGVGVTPWLDLAASFVTRVYLSGQAGNEHFVHSLCFAMIAHQRRGQLALRLEVPIDESARAEDRFLVGLELRGR